VIVAHHPDRLHRRLADLVELTKVVANAGVEIRTVAAGHVDLNTTSGWFTAQVLGAAAEHESARIGERVSMKHRQNAVLGHAHGGPRMSGYRRVARGRIEVVPEEAAVLREAAERVLRGESFASIVIGLNQRGIPSALDRKWRPGSLSMVLKSGRIAGLRESKGVIVGDAHWSRSLAQDVGAGGLESPTPPSVAGRRSICSQVCVAALSAERSWRRHGTPRDGWRPSSGPPRVTRGGRWAARSLRTVRRASAHRPCLDGWNGGRRPHHSTVLSRCIRWDCVPTSRRRSGPSPRRTPAARGGPSSAGTVVRRLARLWRSAQSGPT